MTKTTYTLIPTEHFAKLKNMYAAAPINELYEQPQMVLLPGECELTWKVEPAFFHAGNSLHGSVYFKLLDDAAYFAAQTEELDYFLLTRDFNIRFRKPVTGGILTAKGQMVGENRHHIEAQATLYDAQGEIVGTGKGNFARSTTPLSEVEDYNLQD